TSEEGIDAAGFFQRHLLGIAQVGVGLVLDQEPVFARHLEVNAVEPPLEGLVLFQLRALGNHRRRRFVTPAHGLEDRLLFGGGKLLAVLRSEERRVGKECRSRWSPDHLKKKQEDKKHRSYKSTKKQEYTK